MDLGSWTTKKPETQKEIPGIFSEFQVYPDSREVHVSVTEKVVCW
jgi:hypothetical protein